MPKKHKLPRKKQKKNMLGAKIIKKSVAKKTNEQKNNLSSLLEKAIKAKSFELIQDEPFLLTHRRKTSIHPKDTGYVVLFAESGNEFYGNHVWVLRKRLPSIPKKVTKFCADFYDTSMSEAENLVDPPDIVDTAGAWDDPDFVTEFWNAMERGFIKETPGYETQDGAVLLDPHSVKLEYYYDDTREL